MVFLQVWTELISGSSCDGPRGQDEDGPKQSRYVQYYGSSTLYAFFSTLIIFIGHIFRFHAENDVFREVSLNLFAANYTSPIFDIGKLTEALVAK